MLLQDPVSVMTVHDHPVPYDQGIDHYTFRQDIGFQLFKLLWCKRMDLCLNPEAVRLLQASFRSDLLIVLASAADVAPHHRFVPEECVFGCQGALLSP